MVGGRGGGGGGGGNRNKGEKKFSPVQIADLQLKNRHYADILNHIID